MEIISTTFSPVLKICSETAGASSLVWAGKESGIFSTHSQWTLFSFTSHSASAILTGTEYVKAIRKSRRKCCTS